MSRALRPTASLLLVLSAFWASDASAQLEDELGPDDSESSGSDVPAEATQPRPARDEEGASEPDTESPPAEEGAARPGPAAAEPETAPARAIRVQAGVGLGLGTLSFVRPTAAGTQKLPTTPFAASEFVLHTRIRPEAAFSLDVLLAYQTSVGFTVQLDPLFALPERLDVRAQRAELSLAPVLRLGAAPNDPALAFPVGVLFRSFAPELHQYSIADYKLGSALVRAELWIRLGEWVDLQAGPEAQWLAVIDASLRDEGACCSGFAVGGQGVVQARVGATLRLALAYRQSNAFVPAGGWRFKDVERFLTVRVAGEL